MKIYIKDDDSVYGSVKTLLETIPRNYRFDLQHGRSQKVEYENCWIKIEGALVHSIKELEVPDHAPYVFAVFDLKYTSIFGTLKDALARVAIRAEVSESVELYRVPIK